MKKQSFKPGKMLASLFSAFLVLGIAAFSQAQPCAPALNVTPNPAFPGCKAPGGPPFRVLLILDKSGSISNTAAAMVRTAVKDFAMTLTNATSTTGKFEMGIIDFETNARNALQPDVMIDVKNPGFSGKIQTYLNTGYVPGGGTNFEDALNKVSLFPRVDMIFFITDGNPTSGNTAASFWSGISNNIKTAGTYIFAIGVGSGICVSNLKNLSSPDELNNPSSLQAGADWTLESFSSLGPSLIDLANSLVDTKAPTIACSPNIKGTNDPGLCGKRITYPDPIVNDNCPNFNLVCTPPPGSFFNVGPTNVTCTATDKVGNAASCSFKVTVIDLESPKITCPADKLISCEESVLPANTGSPSTSDNCTVDAVTNVDVRVNGTCPNEFTLNRTWTVTDIHGNFSTCMQTIAVEDKKSPVITCPANITVTCDTSVAKTGLATATDNCDASVSLSHRDIHISGDCDWFCVSERHWTATDDCRNTSKCVQVITKDVTPLIEQALSAGPLKWGQNAATVTLPPGKGACVVQWLPYSGVVPGALKFDDAVAGADCKLMTNPLDASGHILNPLLGEAMKLKILVRLKPSLGTTKLSAIPCDMHFIVRQALAPNPDVNELLRVTDLTLGNVNVNLLVPEHALHLLAVLKCVNAGRSVCNP